METRYWIYEIINTVTGKVYVGQSLELVKRWAAHKNALRANRHINCHLQRAWNKDGEAAFEFRVVAKDLELRDANHQEKELIAQYHREHRGYNFREGGNGGRLAAITRRRISAALCGHNIPADVRKKISDALQGIPLTEETKRKISASLKGRKVSESTRQKIRQKLLGRTVSLSTREKIRARKLGGVPWNKGMIMPKSVGVGVKIRSSRPDTKFKPGFTPWNKGGTHTPVTRAKMSAAKLGTRLTEETKFKMSLAQRARRMREVFHRAA